MITREMAQKLHRSSAQQLRDHSRHPFVVSAPDQIARNMGMERGLQELQQVYETATRTLHHVARPEQYDHRLVQLVRQGQLALNPLDITHTSLEYISLHLTMKSFCPSLSGKTILQLACNFGPFLHFLKHQEGVTVVGVDTASAATKYAQEHGLNVLNASAAALPFRDRSFDMIVSCNFLCPSYMNAITEGRPELMIFPVVREIERTLVPGGLLFSQFEYIPEDATSLTKLKVFSAAARSVFSQLQDIAVYVKS